MQDRRTEDLSKSKSSDDEINFKTDSRYFQHTEHFQDLNFFERPRGPNKKDFGEQTMWRFFQLPYKISVQLTLWHNYGSYSRKFEETLRTS